jgi:hypothetical protein
VRIAEVRLGRREVADRLDVVAVRIADEGAVVVGVILGPDPRFVQDLGATGGGGGEEGPDGPAIRRREGDVRLAKTLAR